MTLMTAAVILAADIFMMGDSTMCDYKAGAYPQEGWGQRLRTFAKDEVKIHNRAVGGISSKTFIDSGRWQKVLDDIKPGDYAIMAFGHNDATKSKPQRYCNKEDYAKNMALFIDGIREKGATPILVTPVERRRFDEKTGEHLGKTLAGYAEAVKSVAVARGVPVVDLNDASYRMHGKMGAKGSAKLQCNNKGKIDNTHHNVYGAYEMARIVAAGLAKIPVVGDAIREPYRTFDPEKPDADPKIPPSGRTDYTKPAGS